MALRDFESFDNIGGGQNNMGNIIYKGWTYGGYQPSIGNGRFGTNGFYTFDRQGYIAKVYDAQSTWIVGWAHGFTGNVLGPMMGFYDQAASNWQLYFHCTGSGGVVQVKRGAPGGGTVLATGTYPIALNAYNYFEAKITIHGSTGSVVLKTNGITDISFTGNTQNTANATANQLLWGEMGLDLYQGHKIDDIYVCDGTGSAPYNDFLGDCRVSSLLPNGNGNSSQFVGSDGNSTDNYLLVDDPGAADPSDYVLSSTVGNKDTYAFANLPSAAGTVYAVKPIIVAAKDDAGSRSICSVARVSSTEVDSANYALGASYVYYPDIRTTKPGGGSWDTTSVNGAEFGVKVTV